MENYVKAVLYAYPYLETVGEDYAQHIKNRALLSYDSRVNAEKLAEYLAEEILHKERLEWLKVVMDEAMSRLDRLERYLLGVCFFGERRGTVQLEESELATWSVRKRLRFKERLCGKVARTLRAAGLTKETFEEELAEIEIIEKIYERVKRRERNA